jgi:hypothetical protein
LTAHYLTKYEEGLNLNLKKYEIFGGIGMGRKRKKVGMGLRFNGRLVGFD